MRTYNLKFISGILFAVIFLVGGLLINTRNVNAANDIQTVTLSYSMSPVVSTLNSENGITTVVRIGCAPGSGDIYDINTGKLCTYFNSSTSSNIRIGCAPGSKDLFDINTGKQCTNDSTPVFRGCVAGSSDIYDITTGKLCTNDTKPVISGCLAGSGDIFNITNGKPCDTRITTVATTQPKSNTSISSVLNKNIIASINRQEPTLVAKNTNTNSNDGELVKPIENEISNDKLVASASKAGLTMLKKPLSRWIIILIAMIILVGGFISNNLINKNKKVEIKNIKPKANTPDPKEQILHKTDGKVVTNAANIHNNSLPQTPLETTQTSQAPKVEAQPVNTVTPASSTTPTTPVTPAVTPTTPVSPTQESLLHK